MNPNPAQCDRKCYNGYNDCLESASDICTFVKYPIVMTGSLTSYGQSGIDVPPPAAVNTGVTDDNQKCDRTSKLCDAKVILEFGTAEEAHNSHEMVRNRGILGLAIRRSIAENARSFDFV